MWKWLRDSFASKPEVSAGRAKTPSPPPSSVEAVPTRSFFRARKEVDVVLGLDFGTSCSKLAYRVLGGDGSIRFIALGAPGLEDPEYCYTSAVAAADDGTPLFGNDAARMLLTRPARDGIRRLKVLIAGEVADTFRDEDLVRQFEMARARFGAAWRALPAPTWFCAVLVDHTLRAITAIETEQGTKVRNLIAQIPVPLEQSEHPATSALYQQALTVVQHVVAEFRSRPLPSPAELLDRVAIEWTAVSAGVRPIGTDYNAITECHAQVAGYLYSLRAMKGVHGVIDIGAGTTDIAIFDLRGPAASDARTYWYAAKSIPRGAAAIERLVADWDGGDPPRSEILAQLADPAAFPPEMTRAITEELRTTKQETHWVWADAYSHSKQSSSWQGVPVFISGGGCKLPGATDVFRRSWVPNWPDFAIQPLPVPDNASFKSDEQANFHRLSTAYGLTYLLPELPEFVPPSLAPDMTPIRTVINWTPDIHPTAP